MASANWLDQSALPIDLEALALARLGAARMITASLPLMQFAASH